MKKKRGQSFEEVVTSVYQQLGPEASVEHDQSITDRLGHRRQFDVVVRGHYAGTRVLGVIECKDTRRKVDVAVVEAFVTKSQEVSANLRILCSRNGFTSRALEKAGHHGIAPVSLISEAPGAPGALIGTCWYASVYRWGRVQITLKLAGEALPDIDAARIAYRGTLLSSWINNHLACHHRSETRLGWVLQLSDVFPAPIDFQSGDRVLQADELSFTVERVVDRYQKMTLLRGRGTYNWLDKTATFPAGATISTDGISTDFEEWDLWDGIERASTGWFQTEIITHAVPPFVEARSALDELLGDPKEAPREAGGEAASTAADHGVSV